MADKPNPKPTTRPTIDDHQTTADEAERILKGDKGKGKGK